MDITIALYSHDSVGLGHARRNRALAYALAEQLPALTGRSVRGLLIAGHPEAGRDSLPAGWNWLVLPGVTTGTDGYFPRHLDATAADEGGGGADMPPNCRCHRLEWLAGLAHSPRATPGGPDVR
ncbi:hypothetical protein [Parenemella sanctibonifatiensis]|uniref:hypothetical protein n=1 Tax=Parenemella sanctibonifatiensis TaxID=2016505 RepID=UPI001E588387|nr:hypothetical protein [Parenemella sanctibonifatiensis]